MNTFIPTPDIFRLFPFMAYVNIVVLVLTVLIHVALAGAVARDASRLQLEPPYRGTVLVGFVVWAVATLIGGVFVAAIYWLLNRSTLRPAANDR